jgi:type II secretory pathway pseudopilin PulG
MTKPSCFPDASLHKYNLGISLLELMLALAVLATLTFGIFSYTKQQSSTVKVQQIVGDFKMLLQAVMVYQKSNDGKAPVSLDALRAQDYLNQMQATNNPWGKEYQLVQPAGSKYVMVTTIVPNDMVESIAAKLPIIRLQALGDNKQQIASYIGFVKQLQKSMLTNAEPGISSAPIRKAAVLDFSKSFMQPYPKPICNKNEVAKVFVVPAIINANSPAAPITSVRAYAMDPGASSTNYYIIYNVESVVGATKPEAKKALVMTKCDLKPAADLMTFD